MFTSGTAPPSGVKLSCARVDRAGRRAGRRGREEARRGRRRSAPPCPPCCRRLVAADATSTSAGCRRPRSRIAIAADADPEHEHRREHRPALPLVADHPPERVRERERDREQRQISRMFVKPVGFSNGCAEFALTEPPPFVPISLIASWLAIGPAGDRSASRPRPSCASVSRGSSGRRPGSRARARARPRAAAARGS